ncbi:MAG: ATP-binding cassette domain-containing protein [Oscillospiraceae bacterium]|nr:ATP-binding cassette domain-containing protein [Oscillospiraceae bacterium]
MESGGRVGILGPSGCGKSTLLRLISGLERPGAGNIEIDDQIVSGTRWVPPHIRAVSMVFQTPALWSHITVEKTLKLIEPDDNRCCEMLERLSIQDLRNRRPGELSYGEVRRVAIARALLRPHSLLLLDEPLTNLNRELKGEILALIIELTRREKSGLIYVTHDETELTNLVDTVYHMYGGMLHEH